MVAWHPRRRRNHRCPVRCSGQGIWARVAGPRRREEGDRRSVSGYNELREVITTRRGVCMGCVHGPLGRVDQCRRRDHICRSPGTITPTVQQPYVPCSSLHSRHPSSRSFLAVTCDPDPTRRSIVFTLYETIGHVATLSH